MSLGAARSDWMPVLAVLSALTMIVGNVVALTQTNLKRMLAYSSIAHAGYMLMGLAAGTEAGLSAVLFYLLSYTFTNMGAFAVLTALARREGEDQTFPQYAGLMRQHPWLTALGTLVLGLWPGPWLQMAQAGWRLFGG